MRLSTLVTVRRIARRSERVRGSTAALALNSSTPATIWSRALPRRAVARRANGGARRLFARLLGGAQCLGLGGQARFGSGDVAEPLAEEARLLSTQAHNSPTLVVREMAEWASSG